MTEIYLCHACSCQEIVRMDTGLAGLKLPLMVQNNEEYMGTKFCVTVDAGPQVRAAPCSAD